MNGVFFLAWALAPSYTLAQATAQPASACEFSITEAAPDVAVRGPEDIVSRLRFITQPGSPVVVTAIDFGKSTLSASETSYQSAIHYSVEVMNVSDRPVSDVRVTVQTRWLNGMGGGGSGTRPSTSFGPGERIVLTAGSRGGGGGPKPSALMVDVWIESLKVGGCAFRPPQLIPQSPQLP